MKVLVDMIRYSNAYGPYKDRSRPSDSKYEWKEMNIEPQQIIDFLNKGIDIKIVYES